MARLRTDLLDKRLLAMLLENSKRLIYWTLVSGQPLNAELEVTMMLSPLIVPPTITPFYWYNSLPASWYAVFTHK